MQPLKSNVRFSTASTSPCVAAPLARRLSRSATTAALDWQVAEQLSKRATKQQKDPTRRAASQNQSINNSRNCTGVGIMNFNQLAYH